MKYTKKQVNSTSLQIYCQNVGGIRTKLQDLNQSILCSINDIIIPLERCLTDDISTVKIDIKAMICTDLRETLPLVIIQEEMMF